jgi:fatty-acyl-CoA synthase
MHAPYSRTLYELLLEQAERDAEAIAVIDAEGSVTYAALAESASRIAAGLAACGIRRGDRVGLLVSNRREWLEIFFGTVALGAVAVPFSTWSKPAELDFLLQDASVRVLFVLETFAERNFADDLAAVLQRVAETHRPQRIVQIGGAPRDGWQAYVEYQAARPLVPMPPGGGASAADSAVILYTSGSSSRPKSVPLDHFAIIENGFNIGERQGLQPGDRVLVSPPLFWSYGGINALPATLTHGATLVLQGRFEAGEALELIE